MRIEMDIENLIEWAKTTDDPGGTLKSRAREAAETPDTAPLRDLITALCIVSPDDGFVIDLARQVEAAHGQTAALSLFIAALDVREDDPVLTIEAAKLAFRMGDVATGVSLGGHAVDLSPDSVPIACGFIDMALGAGAVTDCLVAAGKSLAVAGFDPELVRRVHWSLLDNKAGRPGLSQAQLADLIGPAAALPDVSALIEQFACEPQSEAAPVAETPVVEVNTDVSASSEEGGAEVLQARFASGQASDDDVLALCRLAGEGSPEAPVRWIQILDLGLAFQPTSARLMAERARCWFALGQGILAKEDTETALALDPDNVPLSCLHADIICMADSSAAFDYVQAVLAAHPGDPRLILKLAQIAYWNQDIDTAATALESVELEPGQREAADALKTDILLARGAAGEAEAIALHYLAVAPSTAFHVRNIRAGLALTWPAVPDYIDPVRLARIRASIESVGVASLDIHLLWESVRLFAAIRHFDFALILLRAALSAPVSEMVTAHHFKPFVATLLSRNEWDPRIPDDARELSRELNTAGLAGLSTGGGFLTRAAFEVAHALNPANAAAAFNAGFTALSAGEADVATAHFTGLDRIYQPEMTHVAWPRRGQAMWPDCSYGLAEHYSHRLPQGKTWPRISIVTPSYNQGPYIEETILSILNQEYPNLEYIVCDGLSEDNTISILERYRGRIDHLVIEKDNGQTDAINKGLRLATGELVTWINSDDMLAPGALFNLALAYLNTDSDLIYGMCMPYVDYNFTMSNLPAVRQETFTPEYLADIFNYWMKGFFFYQPEVIFTRRILDRTGGQLDESLYFTMDYDFWMKCAQAGATVEAIYWPITLFRHHENQKTANLLDCMLEQAEVRDKLVALAPPAERSAQIERRLDAILNARGAVRIAVITSRLGKIFSPDSKRDLTAWFDARGIAAELSDSALTLETSPDLLIKLVHLQSDVEEITAFRERHPSVPVVGWFWDNHHHLFANYEVSEVLDIAIPGHDFASSYLRNNKTLHLDSIPLCITQWSHDEARQLWDEAESAARSNELYGGFVRYAFAEKRNALIEALIAAGEKGVYFLEETQLQRYFGKSQKERFTEWAQHKASVCLPLRSDLSQRLFDALLTGQIPVVAPDIPDLNVIFTAEERARLPIITFDAYTPEAVRAAHAEAIRRFDEGGTAAARQRHHFALERHTFPARINDIVTALRQCAARSGNVPAGEARHERTDAV